MRFNIVRSRRRRLLVLAALAAAAALYVPARRGMTAARFLSVVRSVASGETPAGSDIREEKVLRHAADAALEGVVYRPARGESSSAVILLAGVSELGCYHPRLVSLSRSLARMGLLVLTPDIRMFREFRISPPPVGEISFWLREVRRVEGARQVRRVGLAGVSFSASLALIAAAEERNRGAADYLLGIGAFDDLVRCSRFWFESGPVTVSSGYYPTRYYARWVLMLAASDLLPLPEERRHVDSLLRNLLSQKPPPPSPETLSAEGRRWRRLAVMREDEEDPELARRITEHVASILYPALATDEPAARVRCPVFLAHGTYDDLIPPEESRRLREKLLHARSRLLVSPFLTHTHPREKPLGRMAKMRASFDLIAFFYHLAGVV